MIRQDGHHLIDGPLDLLLGFPGLCPPEGACQQQTANQHGDEDMYYTSFAYEISCTTMPQPSGWGSSALLSFPCHLASLSWHCK